MIICKTKDEIEKIAQSAQIASGALAMVKERLKPGISTDDINTWVDKYIRDRGAYPSPLNYHGFPKSVCTSVNEVVCHGIPNPKKIIKEGDIVNVDVTAYKDGFHGDCNFTFLIEPVAEKVKKLVTVTYECLLLGIEQVKPGVHLGTIGNAIQRHAEKNGFSVVREYCGHGIGKEFHEEPMISHYGDYGKGIQLPLGAVFTIEPMINEGTWRTKLQADKWTVHTLDGKLSAQFEHTLAIVEGGVRVLSSFDWLS